MSLVNSSNSFKEHGTTCELCSVYVPNDASMQAHLKGHKHLRNVAKQEEWRRKAETSIYVGGIKNLPAAELSLADYFSTFSLVKKITIDKTSQQYAIIELENSGVIEDLVSTKHHSINGVSVVVKPREVKSSTAHALSKRSKQAEKEPALDEHLTQSLMDCGNVEEQFPILQKLLQLTEEDIRLRFLLCQLLESALQEVFPDCEIKQFGSSANEFGVRGCDLDLTLYYTEVAPEVLSEILSRFEDEEMACDGESSHSAIVKIDRDKSAPVVSDLLSAVAEIIKQCVPDCHKIKSILTARLPVVRFYHKASKMRCDMSLSNYIAVRNTEYLKTCSRVFPQFRPLVYAVRLWMKHWELAGGTHTNGPRLNNYAVTLMALFYLQHCGFLPTLQDMRLTIKEENEVYINGINCSFASNLDQIKAANPCKVSELFSGFFSFYSKIDFPKTVIDLSTGALSSSSDQDFPSNPCQNSSAASQRTKTMKISSLNIRDPFELHHNVAGNVNEKHLKIFTKCIRNAALACKMQRYHSKGKVEEQWGILNLFIDHHHKEKPSHQKAKAENQNYKLKLKRPDTQKVDWSSEVVATLLITVLREVFLISFSSDFTNPNHPEAKYSQTSPVVSEQRENNIELCESEMSDEVTSRKRKLPNSPDFCGICKRTKLMLSSPSATRISSKLDASNLVALPFVSSCVATYKLWEGRRKARRHLVQKGKTDVIELEKQVSKLLLSDRAETASTDDSLNTTDSFNESCSSLDRASQPLFKFSFALTAEEVDSLSVEFQPEVHSTNFTTFFHHLEVFLPGFITKCLSP